MSAKNAKNLDNSEAILLPNWPPPPLRKIVRAGAHRRPFRAPAVPVTLHHPPLWKHYTAGAPRLTSRRAPLLVFKTSRPRAGRN